MRIVGRVTVLDTASGIGEIEPEGGGSRTTVYAADLAGAGIEARVGARLVYSVGSRNGATAAVDLERFWPAPRAGKPLELTGDIVMDQFVDMVRTTKAREVSVKSREQSVIAWEKRLDERRRDLTALEAATISRLQGVEAREAEAKAREERLDGREMALRTAEERHSVARKP